MPENAIALLIVGLIAGVASGMFGIGGGVVIVPALVILGFDLKEAVGTSLGALLMPVGIFAVIAYYRAGKLKLGIAVPIAAGLIGGSIVGAQIVRSLPTATLQQLYGVFLIWIGWRFAEPRKLWRQWRSHTPAPAVTEDSPDVSFSWSFLLVVGLVAGVLAGMFGIGGGAIIVPALVAFLRFDQKLAVGTSLAALLLPVSIGAVVTYYQDGNLEPATAVLVAVGLIVGAFGGARLALGLPSRTVKQLYGFFLIGIGLRFIGALDPIINALAGK
ncbi:MAG: sulfite exporter TauE/SafE family protein [Chloroflexi bacterium]|nr:sulfite exporter TauE/SafE family protein [Chloroflexota bacterium]